MALFTINSEVSVKFLLFSTQDFDRCCGAVHTTFIATTFLVAMADTLLLRALKGQPKSLNLSTKSISQVPRVIGKLGSVNNLQLKNNKISDLPREISGLIKVNSS